MKSTTLRHRRHNSETRGTIALSLVVFFFGASVTGAALALLNGYSMSATPVLTNIDVAVVLFVAGVVAVPLWLPVSLLLAIS